MNCYGFQAVSDIADICKDLTCFQKLTEGCRQGEIRPDFPLVEVEIWFHKLLNEARSFQGDQSPFVQATAFAIELIIHMFWSSHQEKIDPTLVASRMKEALCRLQIRPCSYMDLTSCHFMIGAIASDERSQARTWFVSKLRRAVRALRARGWENPLDIVERGFVPDLNLSIRLKALWEEVSLKCC